MHSSPPIVVFCDLDDTLFNAGRFSIDRAVSAAFNRLEREGIPVVVCSTRTRAELELIQQELGISHPFVCENGGAALVPRGYFAFPIAQAREVGGYEVVRFARPHAETVAVLQRTAARVNVGIVGFSDMSVEDVAVDCNVPLLQARLAKLREYGEQFRIVDNGQRDGAVRLLRALSVVGVESRSLGRYFHAGVRGAYLASNFLRRLYERTAGEIRTVAFGDYPRAVPFLRRADLALIVQNTESEHARDLLAEVPGSRLSAFDSIHEWADMVVEIAEIARASRTSCTR